MFHAYTNGSRRDSKLVGVGAGVKEYVYNQPRAHGVNWRYIRYADVLMMYAEAIVSGGTQASNMTPLQAVNKVRGRVNMSELPSVTMTDIQNERIANLLWKGIVSMICSVGAS